jgi:hypothetical protein
MLNAHRLLLNHGFYHLLRARGSTRIEDHHLQMQSGSGCHLYYSTVGDLPPCLLITVSLSPQEAELQKLSLISPVMMIDRVFVACCSQLNSIRMAHDGHFTQGLVFVHVHYTSFASCATSRLLITSDSVRL